MSLGSVAIVGRPNVGKSTLFNKLTRSRQAIVDDRPGVTRDRIYGIAPGDTPADHFWLIDTGGFETKDFNFQPFGDNLVWRQTEAAIAEAELIIFLVDGRAGVQSHDHQIWRSIQQADKPALVIINKVDGYEMESGCSEFYELGIDEFIPISAAHNRGIGELRETIQDKLRLIQSAQKSQKYDEEAIPLALIGRPNVGKSSLINRMVGSDRSLVSEVAGTTRDSLDSYVRHNNRTYCLIDTAGIRRRAKVKERVEAVSVVKSMQAIERAAVVALVIDAEEGLTDQDARLAQMAISQHKPLLLVVNKWDLISDKETNTAKEYAEDLRHDLKSVSYLPVLFVSCLHNQRVAKIFQECERLFDHAAIRVPTAELNRTLEKIVQGHTPALLRSYRKRIKFFYASQVQTNPPTIVVKCNMAKEIQESYKRYMTNRFREELGFKDVPLRVIFRGKDSDTRKSR